MEMKTEMLDWKGQPVMVETHGTPKHTKIVKPTPRLRLHYVASPWCHQFAQSWRVEFLNPPRLCPRNTTGWHATPKGACDEARILWW